MKKFTIEFNWAIIYTLASLLWNVMEKAVGLHDQYIGKQPLYSVFFGLVAIPIFFLAINDKKKKFYGGRANWTQLFLSGVIMSVFVALFSPLAEYITLHTISPDFIQNNIDHYVRTKKMTRGQATVFFSFRSLILQGISNGISVGVIISALIALYLKPKTADPEPVQSKPKTKTKTKQKRK